MAKKTPNIEITLTDETISIKNRKTKQEVTNLKYDWFFANINRYPELVREIKKNSYSIVEKRKGIPEFCFIAKLLIAIDW